MTYNERRLAEAMIRLGVHPALAPMAVRDLHRGDKTERCPVCQKPVKPAGPTASRWCWECREA